MSFDRMGRRVTKNNWRFVYDGYLCIGKIEDSTSIHYSLSPIHCFVWDPTEPVATRPLAWAHGNSVAYYTHDGNKNVSEVVASDGALAAHYEYAPFGAVVALIGERAVVNPWCFSSEYVDNVLGLIYYNYRHYDQCEGRWKCRDLLLNANDLQYLSNIPIAGTDVLGLLKNGDIVDIRDGFFDFGKPDIGFIKVESFSWNTFYPEYYERYQFGIMLSFTLGDSFASKCCKEDLRWIQWILSDTDIDPRIPVDSTYPKLDVLENSNDVYYSMNDSSEAAVKWNSLGNFLFSDTPTAYKRKDVGETRIKFKTCLVCDKTKDGCDKARDSIKREGNVCYIELKCVEWEIVYGVRLDAKGNKEEYFEAH